MKGSGEARMILRGEKAGGDFIVGELLAYRGKEDCEHPMCTRMVSQNEDGTFAIGKCMGWHCSRCDQPCSSQGHKCSISATGGSAATEKDAGEGT